MKKPLLLLTTFILLIACSNEQTIFLNTKNAKNVQEYAPVYWENNTVGKVNKISFNNDTSLIVQLFIQDTFKIPKDSKISLSKLDLLGTTGVKIIKGESSSFLNNLDTINEVIDQTNPADTLIKSFQKILEELNKKDSTNIKIKKLQLKIDSLKKTVANT